MTRLPGWSYRGPRPGRLPQRRRARRLPRAVRRLVRRARGRRDDRARGRRHARRPPGDGATASSPTAAPGTPATSSSPPGRTGRRTCRRGLAGLDTSGVDLLTSNHYRNPGQLAAGGVLVVGASASGRADRRRAEPGRPRGHPRGRAAHPDAAALPRHGHLLVARERPAAWPAPSTRWPTRWPRAGSRRCSSSGRDDPSGPPRTSTSAACRSAASGWSDGSTRVDGRTASLPRRPRRHRRRRRTRHAPAPRQPSTASSSGSAWPPRCGPARGPRPVRGRRRPRRRLDLRAEGIGTVLVATGYRPAPPVAAAAGHRPRRDRSASTGA